MDGHRSPTDGRVAERDRERERTRDRNPELRSSTDAESPPARCSYCDRPFADDDLLALHRGLEHADRMSESEWEAYERASTAERAALRRYKIRFLLVVVGVYFGFLFLYAVFA